MILRVTNGPAAGASVSLEPGRTINIGRTDEADFHVPGDSEMSSLHFSVHCDGAACRVRDLNSTNGTFVNGRPISEATAQAGDEIRAGRSLFSVAVEQGQSGAAGGKGTTAVVPVVAPVIALDLPNRSADGTADADGFLAKSAAEICGNFDLEADEAKKLLQEGQSPREFLLLLEQRNLLTEALRFLAHALPKRKAVWWATRCVRNVAGEDLPPEDRSALEAAENWVADPTEENRRAAMQVAERLEFRTAACWAAVGAFWSGGSMAPPNAPVVPPGDALTGQAINGAVSLAAVMSQPQKAPERQKSFLQLGLAVARGELDWNQK